jgi:hypothetical protein
MIRLVSTKPRRAANIFGPALIIFSLNPKYLTMPLDKIPKRLYLEKSEALSKKSTARKTTGIML